MSIILHQAIREIYPNAININGDTQETITAWDNDGNNVSINNWETVFAKVSELETAKANEKAQKEADALAGNNKLLELGLTQAQVTAMTGYTPPAEV